MAGLTWNKNTGMAEWDDCKETPTEMCDRLIEENGIGPRRGQSIASSVRSLVFGYVRNDRSIPLSLARNEVHDFVSSDLECDGFNSKMSDDEKDLASYMFERMIEDGWHTLEPDGTPGVYVEPETMQVEDESGHMVTVRVKDGKIQEGEPVAAASSTSGASLAGVLFGLLANAFIGGLLGRKARRA